MEISKLKTNTINTNKSIYILVVYLLSIIPIIDLINGYNLLYETSLGSMIGIIFRMFSFLFFLYLSIMRISTKKLIYIYVLFFYVLVSIFINFYRTASTPGLIDELTYGIKLLLPVVYALGLSNCINLNLVPENIVDKIFFNYAKVVPFTLIIPRIMGIGFDSYALGGGYKGLYFSNNELNILLMAISVFLFWKTIHSYSLSTILLLIFNFFSMLMIGSKTSIIVLFLLVGMYIFYKFSFKKILVILLLASTVVPWMLKIFSTFITDLFFRFQFYYEITNARDNIFNFLLSNRNLRIVPAFENIFNKNGFDALLNFLFGYGHYQQFDANILSTIMEMDLIDTFIWYGIGVTLLILFFYIFVFIKGIKNKEKKEYLIIFFLTFAFSTIAGHVLYSALAGGIFGIVCGNLLSLSKDSLNSNS